MRDTSVPVEDLRAAGFGTEVEKVATAVAGYLADGTGGNVAVISDPYAGRDALLEYAEALLDEDAVRVRLDSSAADGTGPEIPEDRALVVADCHSLFERRIDGFAALDAFLERLALSDALVVTAWNRYAWSYLDAVRDVGDSFPVQVRIPPLDAEEIRTVVESHHGPDLPEFVDTGEAGRVKTVVFDRYPVDLPGGRTLGIPYPKPNPAWVASWSVSGTDESVEAVVFEKLRRVSNGNPGVALAIWERSVEDGEIAPSYVAAPEAGLALDDAAALLLWTVVAMESIGVDRLAALLDGQSVRTNLQLLVDRGLVTVADDTAAVAPEALHLAVAALERRQLLW